MEDNFDESQLLTEDEASKYKKTRADPRVKSMNVIVFTMPKWMNKEKKKAVESCRGKNVL